jgi:DNA-binding transcriptional MerR regulator
MNIGDSVKLIKKEYPSVTISRIRFLEKEGLLKPKRSKGGTRSFTEKDVQRIKKILDLQENQFYSLKAIKNNPQLLTSNSSNSKIVIREYSKHDALKKAGLNEEDFDELVDYKYEQNKNIYSQQDVDRFSSLAYLFSLGLGVKNLSVIKSMSDRGVGFFETYFQITDNDPEEIKIAIDKFSEIIGSYILEDL